MNVLLVVPSQYAVYGIKIKPAYPPIGMLMIGSVLEQAGHAVSLIDMDADGATLDDISTAIANKSVDVLGLTAVTPTFPSCVSIATAMKARFPHLVTVLGGIHVTVATQEAATHACFDYLIVGEGERTIVELLGAIAARRTVAGISGITYRENGHVRTTSSRALEENLDALPFQAMHLLHNIKNYAPADATHLPALPVMVSRGCPAKCTYCQTKQIFGQQLRYRSPEHVIREIRGLVSRYNLKELHFLDDVLTANRPFIRELCKRLADEPYKLHLEVANGLRADMVNEEILGLLKSVGLKNVGFGVESGNERVLKIIKKHLTKDQIRRAFATAKNLGFKTWGFFIVGLPGDDLASVMDTINFAIELNPTYAKFLILKPFPGSEVFHYLEDRGLIFNKDLSQYGTYTPPVHRLETLSADDIFRLQKLAYRRFYFRPAKVVEQLRLMTSLGRAVSVARGARFIWTRAWGARPIP